MSFPFRLMTVASVLLATSACVPLLVGGAATGGVAVAQERSVGSAVDDATIHTKVWNSFLQSNTQNLYSNVAIEVNEGRVLLTGQVATADAAAKAVQLAWNVEGVKEVINEIQVSERGGPNVFAQDAWITTQVKTRLIAEKGVKSINYTIETVNGVVYIMGLAQSDDELARVLNVASRVKGVKRVVSHALLKTDPRRNTGVAETRQQPATDSGYAAPSDNVTPQDGYYDQSATSDMGGDMGNGTVSAPESVYSAPIETAPAPQSYDNQSYGNSGGSDVDSTFTPSY